MVSAEEAGLPGIPSYFTVVSSRLIWGIRESNQALLSGREVMCFAFKLRLHFSRKLRQASA